MGNIEGNIEVFGAASYQKRKIYTISKKIFDAIGFHPDVEIIVAEPKFMRYLNLKYRNKNKVANVLSFCYKDYFFSPYAQIFLEKSKISNKEELTKLLVHAILHIKGYTHTKSFSKKVMEKKEKEILKILL
jgi:rRNA maturation RNase YbeY